MDNQEDRPAGAYDHAEEREIGVQMGRNPIVKEICEAVTLFQCTGSLEGFTSSLARERIRRLLGDEGLARFDEAAAKIVAALEAP